jgi:hypothetical protein
MTRRGQAVVWQLVCLLGAAMASAQTATAQSVAVILISESALSFTSVMTVAGQTSAMVTMAVH